MVVIVKARPDLDALVPAPADLPGSKSHSQRAMLLAGLMPGNCLLRGGLESEDTALLATALERLGARLRRGEAGLAIQGAEQLPLTRIDLQLGENGTALRTLAAILPMLGLQVSLDGRPGLRARPLKPLLDFLQGNQVPHLGETLPLSIDGRQVAWPQRLEVDASLSTQVASGALMGVALRQRRGLSSPDAVLVKAAAAPGYLQITRESLHAFGHATQLSRAGGDQLISFSAATPRPNEIHIPADASTAAFPLVFAAMLGRPPQLADGVSEHPDCGIVSDIQALLDAGDEELVIDDLGSRPDCFPALCALAAVGSGTRVLRGAPALRAKESDRIAAMASGLTALGVDCEELADGLIIRARGRPSAGQAPVSLTAPADHRVIMSLALLGAQMPGGIRLEEDAAVGKSWPGFWDWLGQSALLDFS